MARPVKWSRDLHTIRERAAKAKTETWSRQDIEQLFSVGRASAQSLMKAIGDVQMVGAAHFIDRASLLRFLAEMIDADSVEDALRSRHIDAEPVPQPKTLRTTLPEDLRRAMLPDLPANIVLAPGRIEISADSAEGMLESLVALAMVMQNDLERWKREIEPARATKTVDDDQLRGLVASLRSRRAQ
jgi:hypothetical protein